MQERHEAIRAACSSDINNFCGQNTEEHALRSCIHNNWSSLSQTCKSAITQHHRGGHHRDQDPHQEQQETQQQTDPATGEKPCPVAEKCASDIQTFCPMVDSVEAVRDCIKNNWQSLSVPCREAVEEYMKNHNEVTGSTDFHEVGEDNNAGQTNSHDMSDVNVQIAIGYTWMYWLGRVWWAYPLGLVLLIHVIAFFRIRQLRRIEAGL
jgi:hypothetical protein